MVNKECKQIYERTKEYKRSDYIREIEKLNKINEILEKNNIELSDKANKIKGLCDWLEDEIEHTQERIKSGYKFLGDGKGSYTLEQNLTFYKKALIKVSKKIEEL